MKEQMSDRQTKTKVVLLVLAPLLAIAALLALRPSEPPPAAELKKPEPVAEKKVEPPPAVVQEEAPAADSDAMRAALLGLNKKEPVVLEQKVKPRKVVRHDRPHPPSEDEDQGEDEAINTGLSDAAFRATIEGWRGMKSCVQTSKSKARTDDASGALRMALTIAGSGEVVESRVYDESNDVSKLVARCVEKQVRTLKFPTFALSEPVVKEAKFVF